MFHKTAFSEKPPSLCLVKQASPKPPSTIAGTLSDMIKKAIVVCVFRIGRGAWARGGGEQCQRQEGEGVWRRRGSRGGVGVFCFFVGGLKRRRDALWLKDRKTEMLFLFAFCLKKV